MDGWRQAIGHRGGGESSWGRAAGGIDSAHDQLTLFREAEVTACIRRHAAQLQDRQEEEVQVVQEEEQEEKQITHYVSEMYSVALYSETVSALCVEHRPVTVRHIRGNLRCT